MQKKIALKIYSETGANYNCIQPDNFSTANRTGVMLGFHSIAMTQITFFMLTPDVTLVHPCT